MKGLLATGGLSLVSGERGAAATEDNLPGLPNHPPSERLYPVERNAKYDLDSPLTDKADMFRYNNFYEFSLKKDVYRYVDPFKPFPWEVEIVGLCDKPQKIDIDEMLKKFNFEERIYRFRCVEAWSMIVPWTGFPLSDLLKICEPSSDAKYVSFLSFDRPKQARGQQIYTHYKWPYYEGVRMDEAMNPLAFVATGVYGRQLPKQCGAPIRIVLPWKYGYKGPKSIVRIELTKSRPRTFWNDDQPKEYGFYSNVNPGRPHPRWSQATERRLGSEERIETELYNGYKKEVGHLYKGDEF